VSFTATLQQAWRALRRLVGDDAYEQYCQHHVRHHPEQPLLGRRDYYLSAQQRKWGGVNRCC
jgi:uncharacterized short protein YbdD (DUF466 family)